MEKSSCESTKCPFLDIVNGLWDAKMQFMRSIMPEDKFDKYLKVKKHIYKSRIGVMEGRLAKVEKMIDDIAAAVVGHDEGKEECCNSEKVSES